MILTIANLKTAVASYVAANNIASNSFSETMDNSAGLLDTIGKIYTLDSVYSNDKLYMFDGEFMPFGKTKEEWASDLILAEDYDSSGEDNDAPKDLTYRKPTFSYTLKRKKIKVTVRYNDVERCVHNAAEFTSLVTNKSKRLEDSTYVWKYQAKRELVGKYAQAAIDAMATSTAFATKTAYEAGTYVTSDSSVYVVMFDIKNTNTDTAATLIANGTLVKIDLVRTIATPTDTASGEAFLKALKNDIEVASDISSGNSLNGNTLGASEAGYVFIMKQGIKSVIEVDVEAGAFNPEKLGLPKNTEIAVIPDFGANTGFWGILVDRRAVRLDPTYLAVRSHENADGDFINYVKHFEFTASYSKNTYMKVYKAA